MTFKASKMADMNNMNFHFLHLDSIHFLVVTIPKKLRYPLDCQNSIDKPVICNSTIVGWKSVGIYQASWNAISTHPWHQPAATLVNTNRYCKCSQVLLIMAENIARNM